jgi:hypothetical protein
MILGGTNCTLQQITIAISIEMVSAMLATPTTTYVKRNEMYV